MAAQVVATGMTGTYRQQMWTSVAGDQTLTLDMPRTLLIAFLTHDIRK